jgi:two-component system phosphate regulon response regulator OmpR
VPCGDTGKGSEARDARSSRMKTPRIPASTEHAQMHEAWA